jgi:ribosomal-protein-alanine N-acetyltransferase
MQLTTQRLILREFEESDLEAVHLYSSNQEMTEFMDWGPNTESETAKFLHDCLKNREVTPRINYVFGIVFKGDSHPIGSIGIEIESEIHQKANFGYILRQDFWGRGVIPEASHALLHFGFVSLKLNRISATVRPENARSIRVLEKLGFLKEGHLREEKKIRGVFRDSLLK